MSSTLTETMDVAQVVLYLFWFFFAGLIFWLRREDRREGYPLETDNPKAVLPLMSRVMIPAPKKFLLADGSTVLSPNFERDERPVEGSRVAAAGAALQPGGDPLTSGLGPAAFAMRKDQPELSFHGDKMIVPLRAAPAFSISAGPDPRGYEVVGGDGRPGGKVTEVWVDIVDSMVRYLEYELTDGSQGVRLVPLPIALIDKPSRKVRINAIKGTQFPLVPTTKDKDSITVLEEEKIGAFYAGGRLFADPTRQEPWL